MTDKPTQEHIPEILNNGIIGLQDRLDDLNTNLEHINDRLESLNETLGKRWRASLGNGKFSQKYQSSCR